jgi:hypothetical protein
VMLAVPLAELVQAGHAANLQSWQVVARLRLAPVGETMFPPRAPFFKARLSSRAAERAAAAEEKERGNLPVSPDAPSPHRPKTGR